MFNGWNETRMHHVWRTNFEKSKLPSASQDMQLKFYFQRALIARNRLKRQAMAKPVLSEQEVNTIKERVTYFGQHCVTNFVTNLVILKIGHFKEKSKSSFTCFMAHELWSIINLWSISKYVTYIYIVIQNVYLAKIITSSHLNAFDLTFGSLLNKKSTQFSSFIFKSQGTPIKNSGRPFIFIKKIFNSDLLKRSN